MKIILWQKLDEIHLVFNQRLTAEKIVAIIVVE